MQKNNFTYLLLFTLGFAPIAYSQSVSMEQLLRVAQPIDAETTTACNGITFTTPVAHKQVNVVSFFTSGISTGTAPNGLCNPTTVVGGNAFLAACINSTEASKTYCIDDAGISELSTLAVAGTGATCLQFNDQQGGFVTTANVSCTAVGNCTYTGGFAGNITLGFGGDC